MKYFKVYIKRIYIICLCVVFGNQLNAQDKLSLFIGFQPGITKEPFYPEKEFDVNILPLVVQVPLTKHFDYRATCLVNYHIGGSRQISDVGIQSVMPIFFKNKEQKKMPSSGFYAGPVLGLGYNFLNEHFTTTMAIEPGYLFKTPKHFTLSIGVQVGTSLFSYKNADSKWQNHFGPKVNLGWWL